MPVLMPTPPPFVPVGPERVFRTARLASVQSVKPGMLVSMSYRFFAHDPRPLILVSDRFNAADGNHFVRGVNVHYLPAQVTMTALQNWADSITFTYENVIKHFPILQRAFRSYNINAVFDPVWVDWRGFVTRLIVIRSIDPVERENLVQYVEGMLATRRMDPEQVRESINAEVTRLSNTAPGPPAQVTVQRTVRNG